ncbi:hypothetical protein EVC27_044 [Rhizobium phage RHph_I1_6]|uniref:Uncharacterized protein n=1 Tax=Rhizobium phage RHph_I1_6 TaxID=2509728 RepID=A0A7S5V0Z0_9CAUD|nr:hypothetical protein PP745_gp044 [Rhizobium phage RHph_I1_6]QIG76569.1 hypothetical protein EVC27_044 [Rhizobium phage RHph_I1_6]
MVTKIPESTVSAEDDEKTLSGLVLSSNTFTISLTKGKDIVFRSEGATEVYMSRTEAALLSLALRQACEEAEE